VNQESTTQELDRDRLAKFGKAILDLLNQRGWNTIPRREMTLYLLHFAEETGLLDLTAPRMQLAARLKVSPATLDGLIRDKALVCGNVSNMNFEEFADWARAKGGGDQGVRIMGYGVEARGYRRGARGKRGVRIMGYEVSAKNESGGN